MDTLPGFDHGDAWKSQLPPPTTLRSWLDAAALHGVRFAHLYAQHAHLLLPVQTVFMQAQLPMELELLQADWRSSQAGNILIGPSAASHLPAKRRMIDELLNV